MSEKDLAIVLVSGGMDSLTTLGIACEHHQDIALLHLSYGQKTAKREQECFKNIANFYHIPGERRKIINMDFLGELGGSSLTDKDIKVKKYAPGTEIPNSYVPFRNTHLIALAVSWAEIIKARKIYIGAVEEDSSGYPDCRPSYYKAYNELIRQGSKNGNIQIITPIIGMRKHDIIKKARELKAPLEMTYSCYANEDKACGICDSCFLRLQGFKKAGLEDPIEYANERPS